MRILMTALLISLAACAQAAPKVWQLRAIDGASYDAVAIMHLNTDGRISGRAPCNSFGGAVETNGAQFRVGPIRATRMACPDLRAEQAFFSALAEMTTLRTDGSALTLSNDAGRSMVFTPAD